MKRQMLVIIIFIFYHINGVSGENNKWSWEGDHVINIDVEYTPSSNVKDAPSEQIGMNISRLSGMVPVMTLGKHTVVMGMSYENFSINYKNISQGYHPITQKLVRQKDLPTTLHVTDISLGTAFDINDRWSFMGLIAGGLHSDQGKIRSSDMNLQCLVVFGYSKNMRTQCFFGGAYSDAFGKWQIIPLLGLHWPATENFAVDAMLPMHLLIRYNAAKSVIVGVKTKLLGHEFRLQRGLPWQNDVLTYYQVTVNPYVDIELYKSIILRIESGYTVVRQFEFWDDEYNNKIFQGDLENTWSITPSIRWAF